MDDRTQNGYNNSTGSSETAMLLQIEEVSPDLSFPWRLFLMLRDASDKGFPEVVHWCSSGTAFEIVDKKMLEVSILPRYFNSAKYDTFSRNLRGYGFHPIGKRTFAHESFRRDKSEGCDNITRVKSKKKAFAAATEAATAKKVSQPTSLQASSLAPSTSPTHSIDMPSRTVSDSSSPLLRHDDMEPLSLTDVITDFILPESSWLHDRLLRDMSAYAGQPKQHQGGVLMSSTDVVSSSYDLEPRRIEEMATELNGWYNGTPAMTPNINLIIEYLSPMTLPAVFKSMDISRLGIACGSAVAGVHLIECLLTNFGGCTWCLQARLGRMQHHAMDLILNHMMISSLLLLGEDYFGPSAIIVGLGLCQTLPIFSMSTFKTHFNLFVLDGLSEQEGRVLQYFLSKAIRDVFIWYETSFALLCLWFIFNLGHGSWLLIFGLFLFNLVPLCCSMIYWRHFGHRVVAGKKHKPE